MTTISLPDAGAARQFALMIQTGVPAADAMRYFLPDGESADPKLLQQAGERWLRDPAVRAAQVALNKGEWSDLTPEDRIKLALEKHYNEMAYFLYTTNYGELDGPRKSKADSCRDSLERKLAGMSGKMDALTRFYEDMIVKARAERKAAH
jgi:hypothetical protein